MCCSHGDVTGAILKSGIVSLPITNVHPSNLAACVHAWFVDIYGTYAGLPRYVDVYDIVVYIVITPPLPYTHARSRHNPPLTLTHIMHTRYAHHADRWMHFVYAADTDCHIAKRWKRACLHLWPEDPRRTTILYRTSL